MNLSLVSHTIVNTSHSLGNAVGSNFIQDGVAYLLKARTVEPEKQALVVNGSETTSVSTWRLGKHVLWQRIHMQQ
jgi:hypothetical protein